MKKYVIFSFLLMALLSVGCSDWTEVENKNIDKLLVDADSTLSIAHKNYLANLRAYKQTEHQLTFGWFGGWTGESPASRCLYSLPDSTDVVSLWDGFISLTPAMLADLKRTKEEKGLRVLACSLLFEIGKNITPAQPQSSKDKGESWADYNHAYWGWVDGDEEAISKAIVKYANAICDTIDKYALDGYDLDAEPTVPQPFQTNKEMWQNDRMNLFVRTMGKRIGPMAETEAGRKKWLVVDGQPEWFSAEMALYFNYYILQAYSSTSYSDLDSRLNRVFGKFKTKQTFEEVAKKIIVTENFEAYSGTGGVTHKTRDGQSVPSYIGMAMWEPNGAHKAGIGSYHMEKDYAANPIYKYLRQGIQIMNPAVK
ncbi:glycoside hydrolase family 18 [Prevotella sp. kh1p2]|uniref:glycoside hydrolase family 18 n=1 Tax=Prevotella sp. kh1p2 TaxID=1761883 RepID=UPI0008D7C7C7|nr:glycoside hydrolase family 18 [Prevotella sp. kh1p2]SES85528.1 Putative glycoside hydrolase Family 18, chitinase_18 [Prevotella sp. kh1p2]SNU11043.1 Putative glycoside hydrolase Family 18, chitinase_18 [Prevotellaceae bacterium KH2P17]